RAGGHRGGGPAGRAHGAGGRLRARAPGRLRNGGRRARVHALGRPAPAHRDRTGDHHGPAGADPRRGDRLGGPPGRARDRPRAAMAGRTTFIIAHRLSTIALADELVVLEDGRIAAQGTHEELYATSDLYREIRDSGLARPDLVAEEAA